MSGRAGRNVYVDDYDYGDRNAGERWDRQRFERARARSRGPAAQDIVRVEEYDRNPGRRDIRVEVEENRRPRNPRYKDDNDDNDSDDNGYAPRQRQRRPLYEEDRGGRELAAYRRPPREEEEPPKRRPVRPSYGRRQSSLDTYDRRPRAKYTEDERDINVSINVVPPPGAYPKERDYYREDPRESRPRREEREEVEESESVTEIELPERPKRGKTRMPKRLVHRAALIQLGYAFEEADNFYIVRQALAKPQVDQVIEISESYFNDNKITYDRLIEAPNPPTSRSSMSSASSTTSSSATSVDESPVIVETVTTKIIENPTAADFAAIGRGSGRSRKSASNASGSGSGSDSGSSTETEKPKGRQRTVVAALRADATNPIVVPGRRSAKSVVEEESGMREMAVVPSRKKSVRAQRKELSEEIEKLEAEKRRMDRGDRGERKERRGSGGGEEREEKEEKRSRDSTIVRVEKDKRGRLSLVRPHN